MHLCLPVGLFLVFCARFDFNYFVIFAGKFFIIIFVQYNTFVIIYLTYYVVLYFYNYQYIKLINM